MRFRTISHRFGKAIAVEPEFRMIHWLENSSVIESVTYDDIIEESDKNTPKRKSINMAINNLLRSRLVKKGWAPESAIFNDPDCHQTRWRLDFSKNDISVEVASTTLGYRIESAEAGTRKRTESRGEAEANQTGSRHHGH